MSTTIIYLIRHAQSEFNKQMEGITRAAHIDQWGEYGAPLTEEGLLQAKQLSRELANVHFHSVYSSDLTRARQTAEILLKKRSVSYYQSSDIRERMYGELFNWLPSVEKDNIEGMVTHLPENEKLHYRYSPDGETAMDAVRRLQSFIATISPKHFGKTIAIVNHGNMMRSFLVSIGWARYDELPHNSVKNTGYVILETDGKSHRVKETCRVDKKV